MSEALKSKKNCKTTDITMISATRLFVGNLPENTEANDLRSAFSVFGEITNLDLKSKPGDGNESKKFAFVSLSADNVTVESCKCNLLLDTILRTRVQQK